MCSNKPVEIYTQLIKYKITRPQKLITITIPGNQLQLQLQLQGPEANYNSITRPGNQLQLQLQLQGTNYNSITRPRNQLQSL